MCSVGKINYNYDDHLKGPHSNNEQEDEKHFGDVCLDLDL